LRYGRVAIEAVAYAVPDTVVTTAALEHMLARLYRRLSVPAGFLEQLTGIRARRFWDAGVQPSDAATRAAERLFEQTGFPRDRVEVLVNTSVSRDYLEPSVASLVHGNLRLSAHCQNFDVGNACLGFLTGMATVANLIELGQIQAGVVVAGESSRAVTQHTVRNLLQPEVDFQGLKDNLATLTLGSSATAMLLMDSRIARSTHRLQGGVSLAATEHNRLCVGTEEGMRTDPARLLAEGVKLAGQTWAELLTTLGRSGGDFQEFTLHQVGKANHDTLLRALNLPEDRALRVYPDFGNVGAAGVPMTLAKVAEAGRLRQGDRIALMGIGSGLNCAMMGVEW
jgi:acyl-CoA:acyl-CoA alkyltransferase